MMLPDRQLVHQYSIGLIEIINTGDVWVMFISASPYLLLPCAAAIFLRRRRWRIYIGRWKCPRMDNSAVRFARLGTFICIRMPLEEDVPKPVYERQDKS